jgi:hypothetical protein
VRKIELSRDGARDRALAARGRSIDGDDHESLSCPTMRGLLTAANPCGKARGLIGRVARDRPYFQTFFERLTRSW